MDLVSRFGGLGKVRVTDKERKSIEKLTEIAKKDFLARQLVHQDYKEEFLETMKELFPEVNPRKEEVTLDLDKGTRKGYWCYLQENITYEGSGRGNQLSILVEEPKPQGKRRFIEGIIIIRPVERDSDHIFFMTAEVNKLEDRMYDDIVKILGQGNNPIIKGKRDYKTHLGDSIAYQGIAEVPFLRDVIRLYKRAEEILDNIDPSLGINRSDLSKLRADSHSQNIELARISRDAYHAHLARILMNAQVPQAQEK